jgi:hypothetical protein
MVHALQRAGQRLRAGGSLVSIKPHRTWRPSVAIKSPGHRVEVTSLVNPYFERSLQSADSALARVVKTNWFTLVGERPSRYRISLDRPSQMRTYLELINPPRPRFPPGARARLVSLWSAAPQGSHIEVTESLLITALRRTASNR